MTDTTSKRHSDKIERGHNGGWPGLPFRSPGDIEDVMTLARTNLENFTRATSAMLSGMRELNDEMVRFAGSQLDAGAEAARSIMSAGTPAEALGRHVDFARTATQAYLSQATKLFEVAARMSQNGFTVANDAAHHAAHTAKATIEKSTRK